MEFGNTGLLLIIAAVAILYFIGKFIYNYGKQKGRMEEIEKKLNDPTRRP
jgi:hypothetical protein